MELNQRLQAILDEIPKCRRLADIGTDHAYIPIYAVKKGICRTAVASDVNNGPADRALKNVALYGLEDKVFVRTGYGLDPLNEDECDVIVIAGMGGLQISNILEKGIEKAKKAHRIILQPMSDISSARKWLYDNGFFIEKESLAEENGKFYNIICCRWTGAKAEYDLFGCYIGMPEKFEDEPLFKAYLEKKQMQVARVINGMKKSKSGNAALDKPSLREWTEIYDRLRTILREADI